MAKLHGFSTDDTSLDLNTARMLHACGHYFKEDEVVTIFRDGVDNNIFHFPDKVDCDVKVYLVTGGCTSQRNDGFCTTYTDTTEVLKTPIINSTSWVYTAPLPSARFFLTGASINNRVIISGES